jgi:hypothetical protein
MLQVSEIAVLFVTVYTKYLSIMRKKHTVHYSEWQGVKELQYT